MLDPSGRDSLLRSHPSRASQPHGPRRAVALTLALALALTQLSGCMRVGPDYEPPGPDVPDVWSQELPVGLRLGRGDVRR